jgi:hypothetical protein
MVEIDGSSRPAALAQIFNANDGHGKSRNWESGIFKTEIEKIENKNIKSES